jgi:hypothetical protein
MRVAGSIFQWRFSNMGTGDVTTVFTGGKTPLDKINAGRVWLKNKGLPSAVPEPAANMEEI